MKAKVSFDFEGASGKLSANQRSANQISIDLQPESDTVRHSFLFKVELSESMPELEFIIENASKSNYRKGWENYAPFVSEDLKTWIKLPKGNYNEGKFNFSVVSPINSFYLAWYPSYSTQQHQNCLDQVVRPNSNFKVAQDDLFFSYGDYLALDKPTIIFISRQHPGETMAGYLLEGFVEALAKHSGELDCAFLFFPIVNLEGAQNGNHRYTPDNIDLNRVWGRDDIPTIKTIKDKLSKLANPVLFVDCHGDEVSKIDYIFYSGINKTTQDRVFGPLRKQLQGVHFLQRQPYWKRFLKSLIQRRKILTNPGKLAFDYVQSTYKIPAFTFEISAHKSDHQASHQIGKQLFEGIKNIAWK